MEKYFITGIDTDIGKTFVSLGLCLNLVQKNYKTGYFKPFQSGAYLENGILMAPDVCTINKYLKIPSKYSYLLEGEVSPYLASKLNNTNVDINKVIKDINDFSLSLDKVIIEGAGGLYCPMCNKMLFSDLIKILKIPVIIVTSPNLGRLNHTIMTIECAKNNNLEIKGLIINNMPQNPNISEQHFVEELKEFSDIDILGVIPKMKNPDKDMVIKAFEGINL